MTTVRVADGEPGAECQVDFGKMGLFFDPETDRRRVVQALIFTACYSRHCFVFLSFTQTTEAVIAGFEAAWAFFGGVFKVVIPDNMATIIDKANPTDPRFNQAFIEYARVVASSSTPPGSAGHRTSPGSSGPCPSCEEASSPVSTSSTSPTRSVGPRPGAHPRWARIHGTTQCRPAELFALEEAPRLLEAPVFPYDLPHYAGPKVHRDHHIEVQKALYPSRGI